jgi:hypothetical protein
VEPTTRDAEMHVRNEVEIGRLSFQFADKYPQVPPEWVEDAVRAEFGRRTDLHVQDFVPIFVERNVRAQLRARDLPPSSA